jgi:drug/metabolite transporter (DMT)-like permease
MDYLWILSSVAAAFFQSMRLGAMKELNQTLSVMVTSYVRVLFGLPFMVVYLAGIVVLRGEPLPHANTQFLLYSCAAALMQFAGSTLLVRLFQVGNFAVGTMLQKTDVIATAIIGSLLFSEVISPAGWIAILVTAGGVLLISAARLPQGARLGAAQGLGDLFFGRATRLGLLAGLMFALSYLSLREAILSLDGTQTALMRSAYAAVAMTGWSFLLIGLWLLAFDRDGLRKIPGVALPCTFLGVTSALGTIFWFFASALANASYVAGVAQIQIVFTLAISWFYFGERITKLEFAGMLIILAGVLLFRAV